MRLLITTPTTVVIDVQNVACVRAEDASGSFGILDGHADFLTVLAVSLLRWRGKDRNERYCALRQGVLTVKGGSEVMVATREAVPGTNPDQLESAVLSRFRSSVEEEETARSDAARLELAAIRRIIRHLRPGGVSILGDER
jgi:F-type H+-transporting ATPase subunit epsilon